MSPADRHPSGRQAPTAAPWAEDPLRERLLQRLQQGRARTDALFAALRPGAWFERPIAERHRLLFYLGHLEAFDWNLLVRDCQGQPPQRPEWEQLFAFGIDPVDGGLPQDRPEDWPAVEAVRAWALALRDDVDRAVADAPLRGWLQGGWAARVAIEHRSMHAETLAYLVHRLPLGLLQPGPLPAGVDQAPPRQQQVDIPAGLAALGLDRAAAPHLGWDNEYDRHGVAVAGFRIDRFAATNADWLAFIAAGGYRDPRWWSRTDWAWREQRRIEHPAFWRRDGDGYRLRALRSEVPLPLAWPVYVSHAEASAYARWRGRQLPSEAQWHRAALGTAAGGERTHPWGDDGPLPGVHGNFGFWAEDPSPVDAHPRGQSAFSVHGLVGNGWQWTRSVFAPFAGFRPLPFYRGYSADFFDGRHYVLKGGSPATDVGLLRPSFRNWFQPHYPFVYGAVRCVEE